MRAASLNYWGRGQTIVPVRMSRKQERAKGLTEPLEVSRDNWFVGFENRCMFRRIFCHISRDTPFYLFLIRPNFMGAKL
jgi:hypothetical protein